VIAVLARQNRVLANLATDSDRVLAPLARERKRVSNFIVQANRTGEATAERRADIEASIQRLPGFLRELRPLMADLGGFAAQAAPVARDLNASGEDVSRLIRELGPFQTDSTTALTSLGDALETGRPALLRTRPLIQDLGRFATQARPLSVNLAKLLKSVDKTGGIERAMEFVYFSMTAINGFDDIGHYLRAALVVNLCTPYTAEPAGGCNANFTETRALSAGASAKPDTKANLAAEPKETGAKPEGSVPPTGNIVGGILGQADSQAGRKQAQRIGRGAAGRSPALEDEGEPMLEYLLGDDK
jgi:hypothetical protein